MREPEAKGSVAAKVEAGEPSAVTTSREAARLARVPRCQARRVWWRMWVISRRARRRRPPCSSSSSKTCAVTQERQACSSTCERPTEESFGLRTSQIVHSLHVGRGARTAPECTPGGPGRRTAALAGIAAREDGYREGDHRGRVEDAVAKPHDGEGPRDRVLVDHGLLEVQGLEDSGPGRRRPCPPRAPLAPAAPSSGRGPRRGAPPRPARG